MTQETSDSSLLFSLTRNILYACVKKEKSMLIKHIINVSAMTRNLFWELASVIVYRVAQRFNLFKISYLR